MTVSRVLNGTAGVSEQKRAAVRAAVTSLGYVPNPAARALAAGGSLRIGLLYANPSAGYSSEFLAASLEEAQAHHVHLIVAKCDTTNVPEVVRELSEAGTNALIVPPPLSDDDALAELLEARDIHAVMVAGGGEHPGFSSFGIDNEAAASAMTEHLLSLGHRRIGFIAGDADQRASWERLDGYRRALGHTGVADDEDLIAAGRYTYRSGIEATEHLLDLARPPTAIFAANDEMAAAAIAVAHRRSIDVPGQLSVCGFDDTQLAQAIWPSLTTVRQPIAAMARAATAALVDEVRAARRGYPRAKRRERIAFELIERESVGPSPSI